MRPIGHPDFKYTPWSPERRAAASKAARARAKAGARCRLGPSQGLGSPQRHHTVH